MLTTGNALPKFSLNNQHGELLTNSNFLGKNIVLYFYPKDNTPGCTTESIDFTRLKSDFETLNTVIIGVSKDSVKSHLNFCSKQNLDLTLLSDPELELIQSCGVWKEKSMYGKTFLGIQRATFLFNSEHKAIETWPKVKVAGHAEEVLNKAKELLT